MYSMQLYVIKFISDLITKRVHHGRWFSPDTPASSTTKNGRHDIAEILLKVALNTINQIKSIILGFSVPPTMVHPFCNLHSRERTHVVLVIGLYELLGNPTT
jgi:hypothetical protein